MKEPLKAKPSPKTEPVPWQAWIKSPAYLRLTPKKKIASLLHIIKRKEDEIEKFKKQLETEFDNEDKIVRAVCHNYLKQILSEEKLQDVVIFHLHNLRKRLLGEVKP